MDMSPEISEFIEADTRLQREINHALEAAIDHFQPAADSGRAMVHMLDRTLLPSWQTHVRLQSELILPIAEARMGCAGLRAASLLRAGYPELARHHVAASSALQSFLEPSPLPRRSDLNRLKRQLSAALTARWAHFRLSVRLNIPLSGPLTSAEQALCTLWLATRPQPAFPLNMLLAVPAGHREPAGDPSAGLRLH